VRRWGQDYVGAVDSSTLDLTHRARVTLEVTSAGLTSTLHCRTTSMLMFSFKVRTPNLEQYASRRIVAIFVFI
jgi:hypothetical protein